MESFEEFLSDIAEQPAFWTLVGFVISGIVQYVFSSLLAAKAEKREIAREIRSRDRALQDRRIAHERQLIMDGLRSLGDFRAETLDIQNRFGSFYSVPNEFVGMMRALSEKVVEARTLAEVQKDEVLREAMVEFIRSMRSYMRIDGEDQQQSDEAYETAERKLAEARERARSLLHHDL